MVNLLNKFLYFLIMTRNQIIRVYKNILMGSTKGLVTGDKKIKRKIKILPTINLCWVRYSVPPRSRYYILYTYFSRNLGEGQDAL